MKTLITIIAVVLFAGCQVEENNRECEPFQELVYDDIGEMVTQYACCEGEITVVGEVDLTKNPTHTINHNDCGSCGNVCETGDCVCITNSKLQYVDCHCEE